MPLHLKRLREWHAAVSSYGRRPPWLGMLRALLSGSVPKHVWRARMRVCRNCPVYDRQKKVCWNMNIGMFGAGCRCYCPTLAMTAEPYKGGCWARGVGLTSEGWPAYKKP